MEILDSMNVEEKNNEAKTAASLDETFLSDSDEKEECQLKEQLGHVYRSSWFLGYFKPQPVVFQWILTIFASIGGVLFGVDQSLISAVLLYMPQDLHLTSSQVSMVVGFPALGALLGSAIVPVCNLATGRKGSLIITTVLYTVGAILEADSHGFGTMLAGRMVIGVALGLEGGTVPMYIAECASKKKRGSLISIYQFMLQVGILLGYVVDAMFVNVAGNWRFMLGSSLFFSTLLGLGTVVLPESPRWLVLTDRVNTAYAMWTKTKDLSQLDERKEFFEMKRKVLREHEESKKRMVWLDLFRVRRNFRAVFLGVMLMVIQEFSGINAISYYMGTLLHRSGFSSLDSVYWSMLPGFCGILGTLPPVLLMDRLGRRMMILAPMSVVIISLALCGFSFLIPKTNTSGRTGLYMLGVCIYELFWSQGLGPVPWVILGEVFPAYLRNHGMAVGDFVTFVGNFITTYWFSNMATAMTETGVFAGFFGGITFLGLLYCLLLMPETKDRTLEQLDEVFEMPTKKLVAKNIESSRIAMIDLLHFRFGKALGW
ncbi:hypothetical protein GpartN1_g7262.t1 [Galdieria partita]|uniref:Major facilitator superfamily (MFS) profile domain-containing protein n=1 Tax=Galdieria partita TaxID=83374 RepID=A0A9C7Q3E4_9RHOD|nr:hypothetical protein GpartN1_g7262.t1 [Galdieria partita]